MIARPEVIAAVAAELDSRAGYCLDAHREVGAAIADRLGLRAGVDPIRSDSILVDFGIWIDDAPARVLTEVYLDRLRALPLTHLAVMVERSGGGLDLTWSVAQLSRLARELPDHERVITIWPEPSAAYMARLRAVLPGLLRAIGPSPRTGRYIVEGDLEGRWKRAHLVGYASMSDAGAALVRVLREVELELDAEIELEVTTFPAHAEASAAGVVLGEVRLLLQTYAVAEARGEVRDFEGRVGPARRPYEDVLRARAAAEPGVEICAGLAAWEQADWPGEPEEAMRLALDSAIRAGVRRVRWWSARHVIGASANRYAAHAIEAARPFSR